MHERVAVEDELVLAADRVAESDAHAVLCRARGEDRLALLARPTWNGEAERLTMSSAPAATSSVVGGPGIHMSSQIVTPTFRACHLDDPGLVAGREVPLLVEDAVVREVPLLRPRRSTSPSAQIAQAL